MIIEGNVAFQSLAQTDSFNGQDTGKYNITLLLDDEQASKLEEKGVKLKDFEGQAQRRFTTYRKPRVVDADKEPFEPTLVNRGSHVRLIISFGKPHPMHGVPTYFEAVQVLELGDGDAQEDF